MSDGDNKPYPSRGSVAARAAATVFGVAASVFIHSAVLAAVFLWSDENPGAIPEASEAVSLAMFRSDVLEAVTPSQTREAAASPAAVAADEGANAETPAPADELKSAEPDETLVARNAPLVEAAPAAPEGIEVLEGTLDTEDVTGRERTDEAQKQSRIAPPEKKPARPVTKTKRSDPKPRRKSKTTAKRKGGTRSRASKGSAASSGRVSASRGAAINYAAKVRARVASRRPAGGGRRGTVVVSFGVSGSGSLAYARIGRSSGNAALDRRVLSAVRGAAPFPRPPPGATRRFSIPFYFR